jgi:N-acetyl-D-muramate 6-phosphate phosphatase
MTPVARTLLVDLDGTLLDTAPDMGAALNALRAQEGFEPLPAEVIRPQVSHGAAGLIRLAFPGATPPVQAHLRFRFVHLYRANLTAHGTALFDGFAPLLATLSAHGRRWGVVTNKPAWLTDPLLATLALPHPPAVVVSGDTTPERKPHPLPITHACLELGVEPSECLYLGDAERDIAAARAAGLTTAIALWGYLEDRESIAAWGADYRLEHPHALAPLLGLGL